MTTNKKRNIRIIRAVSVVVLLFGALTSAVLTINAGHKNASLLLPVLFLIWVLSPYVMLLITNNRLGQQPEICRMIAYISILLLTIGSVIAYTGILTPPGTKPAAVFLMVPLLSWVFIIIGMVILKSVVMNPLTPK